MVAIDNNLEKIFEVEQSGNLLVFFFVFKKKLSLAFCKKIAHKVIISLQIMCIHDKNLFINQCS